MSYEQYYGRNDMVMLDKHNKIYGSLGIKQEVQGVLRTIEGYPPLIGEKSIKDKPVKIGLQGWTEQDKYNGYQLFDASKLLSKEQGGAIVTNNDDGSFTISGNGSLSETFSIQYDFSTEEAIKLIKEGNFYLKVNSVTIPSVYYGIYEISTGSAIKVLTSKNGSYLGTNFTNEEISKISSGEYKLSELIYGSYGSTILPGTIKPMIYQYGDGTYEPYTGGQPSPSPEYQQDVNNAGKYNEEIGKYEVEVKLTGKNLLDIPDITEETPGLEYVECNFYENIFIGVYGELAEVSSSIWRFIVTYKDGSSLYITDSQIKSNGGGWFRASLENPIVKIGYRGTYITSGKYSKIQVEYQEQYGVIGKTSYEEYKEPKSIIITSDHPITKWDRMIEKDGQIGWEYGGKEIVFDGSENWISTSQDNLFSLSGFEGATKSFECFCDKLINHIGTPNEQMPYNSILANTTNLYIKISSISDVDEFKRWLSIEKPKVFYYSKLIEFAPLPSEEQNAIKALKTYYPTTVFSNNQEMLMNVTYSAFENNV